jgi:2-oxoglutarate dehydrogenase E2 component (dihydrolipoamide succinyltransferase)
VEPWSKIRKITADHMVMSRRVSAHVASFFEVDFTRVAQLRAKAKQTYAERGVNLTFLAFIVKACAENLRKHPIVNSAVSGDSTIYRGEVNIGIAVALDWGLIVPVIKHADELALKVLTADDGTESIAIRTMGMLTMSYDHRVVDGADADRFLADVKNLLQEFPEGAV